MYEMLDRVTRDSLTEEVTFKVKMLKLNHLEVSTVVYTSLVFTYMH